MDEAKNDIQSFENEKGKLETELQEIKDENSTLTKASTDRSNTEISPEQYLDVLAEEKDLNGLAHFCQLVNAKYQQLWSQ